MRYELSHSFFWAMVEACEDPNLPMEKADEWVFTYCNYGV